MWVNDAHKAKITSAPGSKTYVPDLSGGFGSASDPSLWPVQLGDFLELNPPGSAVQNIVGVTAGNDGTHPNQISILSTSAPLPAGSTSSYTIIRAPRVLVGEPVLQLPQDVVIDMNHLNDPTNNGTLITGDPVGTHTYYDILFAPSGSVMRAGADWKNRAPD